MSERIEPGYTMKWVTLGLGLLVAAMSSAAPDEARVAVVIVRAPDGININLAYPPGTSEAVVREDVEAVSRWSGGWELSPPVVTTETSGTTATVQLVDAPAGSELTIWPFVAALSRFEEIVVAYVGPSAEGRGKLENRCVTVDWSAQASGITYRVVVRDRSFRSLRDLWMAGPKEPPRAPVKTPWAAVVSVFALAIAAGLMTYCMLWRVMRSQRPAGLSAEEDGYRD